jgi:integrase
VSEFIRKTLSDRGVKTAKAPETGRTEILDAIIPQLALRMNATGEKRYVVRTRISGRQVRKTLGDPSVITLDEARDLAGDVLKYAKRGVDILAQRQAEAEAAAAAKAITDSNTVEAVATLFYADIGAVKPDEDGSTKKPKHGGKKANQLRSAGEVKRTIDRLILPKFGSRPIGSITRRELIAHFDEIAVKNGPIAANRALAWTGRLFRWAISKAIIDASSVVDIEKPGEERKGTRVLSDDELREVWAAASTLPFPYGHYIKALVLTGRRRTSVAEMRRSEVDRTARVWRPLGGTDNKQQPELPLFKMLEDLLDSIPERGEADKDADHIFRTGVADIPVNSFAAAKEKLDEAIAAARKAAGIKKAMPEWDLSRDLRRTVKTRLADLRVPKEIRDLIMGHAKQGMDAVYDHSERRDEKRDGLERWGHHLADILSGKKPDNVVTLRAAQ